MIFVASNQLEPGMVLGAPVPHPNAPDRDLLKAGYKFVPETISRIQSLGISSVWIHHPSLDFLDRHLGREIPEARAATFRRIKQAFEKSSRRTDAPLDIATYKQTVSGLITGLLADREHAVFGERLFSDNSELAGHSANVTYLSLLLGLKLGDYIAVNRPQLTGARAREVTNLGIGAMLHDIGKLTLERNLQNAHGTDPKVRDDPQYREHTTAGYQMLQSRAEPSATQILLNHHQRWDGNGFPEIVSRQGEHRQPPLSGRKIHIFSRIVSVANVFDSFLQGDGDQQTTAAEALWRLQSEEFRGFFDPLVLAQFLKLVPPFPVATTVQLSDGRRGVVIGLQPDKPCRPKIRILGEKEADVDLAEDDNLTIETHLGRNVSPYYYEPPSVAELYTAEDSLFATAPN